MMGSYDLAWELVHVLNGLSADLQSFMDTFEVDRRKNALNLIDMDKRWYQGPIRQKGQNQLENRAFCR